MLEKIGLARLSAVALLVSLLPLAANAGEVDNRVNRQQSRINHGVNSGQLTRGEYARVDSRLNNINATRRSDLRANGGTLTAAEKHNLNVRENHLSRSIYFDKHNLRRQPGAPPQ